MLAAVVVRPPVAVRCSSGRWGLCKAGRPHLPPRFVRAAAGTARPVLTNVHVEAQDALQRAEAHVEAWVAQISSAAAGTASRLQSCLLGLLLLVQRALHWVQLAAVAVHLQQQSAQQQQQQQQQLAFAGVGSGNSNAETATPVAAAASPAAASADAVMGFVSAATSGAVEQLRHTLNDATQGIESRMSAIERTAGSLQATLFKAAQTHSEAVRSNPERGMWKQPSVDAVISEEERLRCAVFAQVFAELAQKDVSFKAQP